MIFSASPPKHPNLPLGHLNTSLNNHLPQSTMYPHVWLPFSENLPTQWAAGAAQALILHSNLCSNSSIPARPERRSIVRPAWPHAQTSNFGLH